MSETTEKLVGIKQVLLPELKQPKKLAQPKVICGLLEITILRYITISI